MDFAKKQLEKYGWTEGKGLGRNEDGIAQPLKPKLKFDNSGVGHDLGEQFTNNWWEKLFNNAAKNINVQVDSNEVKMQVKDADLIEISTRSYSLKALKKNKNLEYGSFLKTEKLTENGVENFAVPNFQFEQPPSQQRLTDEELFAACGGRTAHKGARHGLKLSGKLARIEKQEKMLLKQMRKVSIDENNPVEKKLKKIKKLSKKSQNKPAAPQATLSPSSKTKKMSRKSVTFNDTTTTKYYAVDEFENSFDSEVSSIRDENSNESVALDEGIENDMDNNNLVQDDHRSFEEAQFSDLSKAERRKLEKKRKLEAKNKIAEECDVDMEDNIKKRKLQAVDECKSGQSETESISRLERKKNRSKRKKQKKLELKQMKSIVEDLGSYCKISEEQ